MDPIGTTIGIAGLLLAIWVYYRSSAQLRAEAGELRRLTLILMRALEEAGKITLSTNAGGEIIGFKMTAGVEEKVTLSAAQDAEYVGPRGR